MKKLKRLEDVSAILAGGIIVCACVKLLFDNSPEWMTIYFYIFFGISIICYVIRYVITMYRKKVKPVIDKTGEIIMAVNQAKREVEEITKNQNHGRKEI